MATPIQLGPTDFTLALDGTAQHLSDVLAAVVAANQGLDFEPKVRILILQADGANGNAIYVGFSNAVSSTLHAFSIPAGVGGVPATPIILSALQLPELLLSHLWVKGTDGQKLHIGLIPIVG